MFIYYVVHVCDVYFKSTFTFWNTISIFFILDSSHLNLCTNVIIVVFCEYRRSSRVWGVSMVYYWILLYSRLLPHLLLCLAAVCGMATIEYPCFIKYLRVGGWGVVSLKKIMMHLIISLSPTQNYLTVSGQCTAVCWKLLNPIHIISDT